MNGQKRRCAKGFFRFILGESNDESFTEFVVDDRKTDKNGHSVRDGIFCNIRRSFFVQMIKMSER